MTLKRGLSWILTLLGSQAVFAQPTPTTPTYRRMKEYLASIPAIDTHDHLFQPERIARLVETAEGPGANLWAVWKHSYFPILHPWPEWRPGASFDQWWPAARGCFTNARATSFYRYMLPAFEDLYGVDFDAITDEQAGQLDRRIHGQYRNPEWVAEVITRRANIEWIVNDQFWERIDAAAHYPFTAPVLNVTMLGKGYHASGADNTHDIPYEFARRNGLKLETLDDYLVVLDRLFQERKATGVVCLKNTQAYERTLLFDRVPRERAAAVFGRPRKDLTDEDVKAFDDFIMWHVTGLAARYDLPFQIHTGQARIQGSNPMLLAELIEANPKTKFVLFHGGFPWVGESGALVMRHHPHVWIDSVWLPTLSYSMARRAFHEWLDMMPSNRLMWGADSGLPEGIYGAAEFTRRCIAEVLAERIDRGELREDHARHIGRQILRNNALELFPTLNGSSIDRTAEEAKSR